MVILSCLDLLVGHLTALRLLAEQVCLGEYQHHWLVRFDLRNLVLPPVNIIERVWVWHRHTYHKHVRAPVLSGTIDTKMIVSARVMDLDIDLDFLDVLGTAEDIKHGRLVILREAILQVVAYEARFADRSVADKHDFN